MRYDTLKHECFFCGRDLNDGIVLWDKTIKDVMTIRSKIITNADGKMVHGKTVLCRCGLAQEYEPMTIRTLNKFYECDEKGISPYRRIYPIPDGAIERHIKNSMRFLFENAQAMGDGRSMLAFKSNSTRLRVLIVGSGDKKSQKIIEESIQADCFTYEPGLPESDTNYKNFPEGEEFNIIICNNTLEHIYNPLEFLREMRKLCNEDTRFILSVPELMTSSVNMPKDAWFSNAHLYHFTLYTLMGVVMKAGFNVEHGAMIEEEMGDKEYMILRRPPNDFTIRNIPELSLEALNKIVKFVAYQDECYRLREDVLSFGSINKQGN